MQFRSIRGARERRGKSASALARSISSSQVSIEQLEERRLLTAAPTNVLAANGTTPTDLQLSWNSAAGATSYQVWRSTTASTNSATDIAPSVSGTTYDDTLLTVGTTYFYWVVASGGSGNSAFSTIASGTAGTLVWSDTFGSDGISSDWGAENAADPNNLNVHYTNNQVGTANNPVTEQITSDPNATDGEALAMSLTPAPGQSGVYDSAEISTAMNQPNSSNQMEYGEITARIKLPGGSNSGAIWPAFWMLGDNISSVGWPASGEIDIMENKGSTPGTNYSTLHGPTSGGGDYNGGSGVGSSYTLPQGADFYSAYHVFTLNWGPNSVTFSVDGQVYETLTPSSLPSGDSWVFNGHPFYIILDVNEGGKFAPGTITSTQTMDIDYVRAYSLPAPTGLAAAIGTSSNPPSVSWSAVNGATSYEVWRNTTGSVISAIEIKSGVTGTSYSDTSGTTGTNYYYWVVSADAYQTSGFSASASTILVPTVTIASPPPNIVYDGTTDVTNWVVATVTGVNGSPAPTGSATIVYYSGMTATGTPLSSSPVNAGTYTVVANYAGDSHYVPAQSTPVIFTINNPAGISTSTGAQYTISGPSGAQTLDVLSGIVTLTADLSTTYPNYNLQVENGANVVLAAGQNLTQLELIGNGSIDVSGYSIMINYGASDGGDPISTIQAELTSGFNGGVWTGTGIYSSMAAKTNGYSLGYADGADNVVVGLPSGQIEIKYVLYGDVNLDGLVNGSDLAIFGGNLNKSVTGWDKGDLTYDDLVNGTDLGLLGTNLGKSASVPSVELSEATGLMTASNSDDIATTTSPVLTSDSSEDGSDAVVLKSGSKKTISKSTVTVNHVVAVAPNTFKGWGRIGSEWR